MNSNFTKEEKINYMLKKHIKENLFEYILDFICPILLTALLLYLCKADEYIYGIILSVAYSFGKLGYSLHDYKKRVSKEV